MPKTSHPHKLRRHKYKSGNAVYFCTLPDCHYKIDVPLAIGKRSLCNICGQEFLMTEYTIKLLLPHCNECGKVKIIDAEGKKRFVKKVTNQLLTGIAADTTDSLRSRLDNTVAAASEDDI